MKVLVTLALLALSLAAVRCEASGVQWNTFEGWETSSWFDDGSYSGDWVPAYTVHSYGPFGTPEVIFTYTLNSRDRIISATPNGDCNVGAPMAYWVWAQAGDILNDLSDFKSHDLVFECHCDGIHTDAVGSGITLGPYINTYYLALIGGENFDEYWGWVELEGNWVDGLSVVASAITNEGPLIVGGGLAYEGSVPEPTSGLLLLVGSALLLVRRQRTQEVRHAFL